MAVIKSGATTDQLTVDPTNKSARSLPCPTGAIAESNLTAKYIASTAAALLSASPASVYGVVLLNLATTSGAAGVHYIHFFNTSTTAGLATSSWLFELPIPSPATASTVGQALSIPPGSFGLMNFTVGIVIVINTTSTSNVTASGVNPVGVVWID